jgi:hypothetical protein
MDPSRSLFQIHTSFAHLHNAWVAEAVSFCGGVVGNCQRLSACVYSFQLLAVFRIMKTALCKTGRARVNRIQPPRALVYKSLPYKQ